MGLAWMPRRRVSPCRRRSRSPPPFWYVRVYCTHAWIGADMLQWWVRMVNQMEVEGNSVEVGHSIFSEGQVGSDKHFSESKTTSLSTRSRARFRRRSRLRRGPLQGRLCLTSCPPSIRRTGRLDNLEVTIKSGEKVGIVGRTGSGKSTLVSARKASGGDLLRVHSVQRDAVY
jgi:ABC-type multidrug transport system fused ATPase/permease subunit